MCTTSGCRDVSIFDSPPTPDHQKVEDNKGRNYNKKKEESLLRGDDEDVYRYYTEDDRDDTKESLDPRVYHHGFDVEQETPQSSITDYHELLIMMETKSSESHVTSTNSAVDDGKSTDTDGNFSNPGLLASKEENNSPNVESGDSLTVSNSSQDEVEHEDKQQIVLALMDLFSRQRKDTCPDRLKELYRIGTQNLMLKKVQAYIKDLQESRRVVKFEMSLQKRKEKKKQKYRQSLRQEPCCERLYSRALAKQEEAKQRIKQIAQTREQDTKAFNIYAAFKNEYVY